MYYKYYIIFFYVGTLYIQCIVTYILILILNKHKFKTLRFCLKQNKIFLVDTLCYYYAKLHFKHKTICHKIRNRNPNKKVTLLL